MNALVEYAWPGNIRELKNIIERLVILTEEIIEVSDIPYEIKNAPKASNFKELTLKEFKEKDEKKYIIHLLKDYQGNVSRVAKILDIERTYLHRKIKEYGIEKTSLYK